MHRQLLIYFVSLLGIQGLMLPAYSQDYTHNYTSQTFTTGHGLADMSINSLFQDKRGYLWIGTQSGISRFDGLTFKNYYSTDGLRDNEGNDFIQMNDDSIAILTRYGISFLAYDKISTIHLPDGFSSQFWSYQAAAHNKLYLFNLTVDRTKADFPLRHFEFNSNTKKFTPLTELDNTDIIKVFTNSQGVINIFTRKGQWWQLKQGKLDSVSRVANSLLDICSITDSLFYYYDLNRQAFYKLTLNGHSFDTTRYVTFPHDGYPLKRNLVGTSSGDLYFNNNNDTIFKISKGSIEPAVVSDEAYQDIIVDKLDALWLGAAHGLRAWYHFYFQEHRFNRERNGMVLNILPGNASQTWFSGHNNGIWYLENNKVKSLEPRQVQGMNEKVQRFFASQVKGAVRLTDGRIYFPFHYGLIEVGKNKYTLHFLERAGIYTLLEDETGKGVYIASHYGLRKFMPDQGYSDLVFPNNYNNAIVYNLFKDKQQNRWAFTENGAGIIRQDTIHAVKELDSLAITSIDQDVEQRYWIGTRQGLYCYKRGQKPWRVSADEFKGEINAVKVYDAQTLVVIDNQHIGFLNIGPSAGSEAWITFNSHTGYSGEDFLGRSIYADSTGTLWLTCGDRVISCNPSTIIRERPLSTVFIKHFASSDDNVQWDTLGQIPASLSLMPGSRNIRIEFLSVYLADPRGVRYQYRLKGLSDAWSASVPDNYVIYSHLRSGKYQFEVRSSVDGIHWSGTAAQVNFYIPPFWWQTWWFIVLVVLSAGILLWLFSRYYISLKWKQQMRRLEKQLAIEQERHRISGEIHDDLGAGLSGIRLQAELASRKASTPEMKTELSRIYNIASELSARMREVIWSLNTENDNLEKLLYYMQQEGFKMFEHTNITFRAGYPSPLPDISVNGQKRRDIYLIVKEALHNALKHAAAGEVSLQAELVKDILQITVRDNGVGISPALKSDGNGIRNMQQRTAKTGGRLQIVHEKGTVVHFEIDIQSLVKQ